MIRDLLVFYKKERGLVTVTERASASCTDSATSVALPPALTPLCDRAVTAASRSLGGSHSSRCGSTRGTGRSGRCHQGSSGRTYSSSVVPVIHVNPARASNNVGQSHSRAEFA